MSHAVTNPQADLRRAAELLAAADYVVALTGAGISVESGIPPFRGPGGLWTKYGEPPMDGYRRFLQDPKKAWEERLAPSGASKEIRDTIAVAQPNPGHVALVHLEEMGVLRALITQNVDNLHRRAGSRRLLEIHGNYTLVRCIRCTARFPADTISLDTLPPHCPQCGGILKSDTVAFGEPIPADVLEACFQEVERCDCMLVAGTSATVYPAAWFPLAVRERGGVLIEVNLYESELTPLCTLSLRGPTGELLPRLVQEVHALRAQRPAS
ncbi:MAG: NAD-dependent deacylase [Candidatus Tectimicrobiota bacterium]|nr:MAG: NAD-dependent deacylase [Candidatus Tectomicrobia bacterium]